MGSGPESESNPMKKNRKILSLLLLGLALALSACSQPAPKPGGQTDTASKLPAIVGTWQSPEYVDMMGMENADTYFGEGAVRSFRFTEDGKMLGLVNGKPLMEAVQEALKNTALTEGVREALMGMTALDVSYKVDGDKINITTSYDGGALEETWGFRMAGERMVFTIGEKDVHFDRVK